MSFPLDDHDMIQMVTLTIGQGHLDLSPHSCFSICLFTSHPIITKFYTHRLVVSINRFSIFFDWPQKFVFMGRYICPVADANVTCFLLTPAKDEQIMSASLTSAAPIATEPSTIPPNIAKLYVYFGVSFDDNLILPLALRRLYARALSGVQPTDILERTPSSLVLYLTGHYMASFSSRSVRILSRRNFGYSVDPLADVYSYNFPDDKPIVKFLGEYKRFFHPLNQVTSLCNQPTSPFYWRPFKRP